MRYELYVAFSYPCCMTFFSICTRWWNWWWMFIISYSSLLSEIEGTKTRFTIFFFCLPVMITYASFMKKNLRMRLESRKPQKAPPKNLGTSMNQTLLHAALAFRMLCKLSRKGPLFDLSTPDITLIFKSIFGLRVISIDYSLVAAAGKHHKNEK